MKLIPFALLLLTIVSCNKDIDSDSGTLIFGQFHGMCLGDKCNQVYYLKNDQLFVDQDAKYPNIDKPYVGKWKKESGVKASDYTTLMHSMPAELLNMESQSFGCPDCADQGGFYIEFRANGSLHQFRLDKSISANPEYVQDYLVLLNAKLAELEQ